MSYQPSLFSGTSLSIDAEFHGVERIVLSDGGASRTFMLGEGALLVTGRGTQRKWEHSVTKVAQAGPRIRLAFR
jgi:hypothetical protein